MHDGAGHAPEVRPDAVGSDDRAGRLALWERWTCVSIC